MATCFERIQDIAKGKFSDPELRDILKDVEKQVAERESLADVSGDALQQSINDSTDKLKDGIESELHRLNLEELNVARSAALSPAFMKLKNNPLKKFGRSLTMGISTMVKGAKARELDIHLVKRRMDGRVQFTRAITKIKDGMPILKSSQYESVIVDAINGKETNNKTANEIGKAIRGLWDDGENELNKHGISRNKLEDRGFHQTHDADEFLKTNDSFIDRTKLRKQHFRDDGKADIFKDVAFNRWKEFITPLLNLGKTFGEFTSKNERERNRILREIFDSVTSDASNPGGTTVQQQINSSRFFHFKDSVSQLSYNKKFGSGSLFESLIQESGSTWSKIGVLEYAGNNPLRYIEKTIRLAAKNSDRTFTKATVNNAVDESKYSMQQVLGLNSNVHGASGKLVNAIKVALFAKIAPTLFPLVAIADVGPAINTMAQLGGRSTISSTVKIFKIARAAASNDKELADYVDAMGFHYDIQLGATHKWSGLENPGLKNRLMSFMMKFSPHEFMNYVEGLSVSHEMTLMLGQHAKLAFEKLPQPLSETLDHYGIDEGRWDLLRKGTVKVGKTTHITTDSVRNVPKEEIIRSLKKRFNLDRVSDSRVERERDQTQQLFSQMITDKMATGSNLVSTRQRSFWNLGFDLRTDKGRKMANLFSLLGSLRYYETAIVHRTLAPLIYGQAGESVTNQILGGKFDKIGLARWGAISFTTGAIAFTLQSLMQGKEPDPSEIFTRSLLSFLGAIGQGLEIGSGYNHGALRTVAGAGGSTLADTVDDLAKIVRVDHPVKNAVNIATQIVPGLNNSISRNAINHLIQYFFGSMHRG